MRLTCSSARPPNRRISADATNELHHWRRTLQGDQLSRICALGPRHRGHPASAAGQTEHQGENEELLRGSRPTACPTSQPQCQHDGQRNALRRHEPGRHRSTQPLTRCHQATEQQPGLTPPFASQVADAADGGGALGHRDPPRASSRLKVWLHLSTIHRCRQIARWIRRFRFINGEQLLEPLRIGRLEIEMALALLKGQPDIAVTALSRPDVSTSEVHRQSLKAVAQWTPARGTAGSR